MNSILLIENNNDLLENLKEYLEMKGYAVFEALNGKIGLEIAQKSLPDLIVCDIMMPEMNGYEVLRRLLCTAKTHDIPFIFSTAMSEKRDCSKAMELGADDYIIKPFELEVLLAIAEKWISSGSLRVRNGSTIYA